MTEKWYDSDNPSKVARGAGWRIGVAVIAVMIFVGLIGAVVWGIGVLTSDVAGQGNAVKKKNDAVNRIAAQEGFEQDYADIKAADQKVAIAKEALDASPDDYTVKVNYTGTRTACVTFVNDYNARARKFTQQDFRAADLPYQIDELDPATDCK